MQGSGLGGLADESSDDDQNFPGGGSLTFCRYFSCAVFGGEAQTQSPLSSQEGSLLGVVTLSHRNGQRNKEHPACNVKCPSIDLIL